MSSTKPAGAAAAKGGEPKPVLLEMPPDDEIGIYPTFSHPDNPFPGWLRDKVIVFKQEGPAGAKPVYLQVNGFMIGIPRDQEVEIPRPHRLALENAIEERWERDEVTGEEHPRKVRRYNWELKEEGSNLPKLKAALQKHIDKQNRLLLKEWQERKANVDNA